MYEHATHKEKRRKKKGFEKEYKKSGKFTLIYSTTLIVLSRGARGAEEINNLLGQK